MSTLGPFLARAATKEKEAAEGHLEVAGIGVSSDVAIYIAPLLVIGTLVYLLLHMRFLYSMVESARASTSTVPWLGFMRDRAAQAAFTASLLVTPVAAITFLVTRSGVDERLEYLLAALYSTAILYLEVMVVLTNAKARRVFHSPSRRSPVEVPSQPIKAPARHDEVLR